MRRSPVTGSGSTPRSASASGNWHAWARAWARALRPPVRGCRRGGWCALAREWWRTAGTALVQHARVVAERSATGNFARHGLDVARRLGLGTFAAAGAYWGVLYGWIAALAGPRSASAQSSQRSRRSSLVAAVLVVVLVIVAYALVAVGGDRAWNRATQTEAAEAERVALEEAGTPRTGAVPDPYADGEAVPLRDEQAEPRDPQWCAAEETTLMFGEPDAASGHRVLPLRAVNGSDTSCVLNGYPDIAFADQNGHLLEVELEHGGSFMVSEDAGPVSVTLEPGAWAVSYIGWNANSTQGQLVAAEVYSALMPGDERHSWPPRVPLDIVPGATVAVTAWAADAGGAWLRHRLCAPANNQFRCQALALGHRAANHLGEQFVAAKAHAVHG